MDFLWLAIVAVVFLVFIISWNYKKPPANVAQIILRTTRYAVFFSPAIAGGEGFGLPAPFILAAPINSTLPHLLPKFVLIPFAATWVVIFLFQYVRYRSSLKSLTHHSSGTPNGAP